MKRGLGVLLGAFRSDNVQTALWSHCVQLSKHAEQLQSQPERHGQTRELK